MVRAADPTQVAAMIALLPIAAIAGWLLADFLSGIVHWMEDRYGREDWPLLGKHVVAPNRLHHAAPLAFTRAPFMVRNGTTMIAALALAGGLAAGLLALFGQLPWPVWLALAVATIGGCLGNQVHYWAHLPRRAPAIVRAAQAIGLCQSRSQHSQHHAVPHLTRYCVLTDWLNPVLDRIRFWRMLERLLPQRWLA